MKPRVRVTAVVFATISFLLVGSSTSFAEIVARAEATELRLSSGKIKPRVARDPDGSVTMLLLNGMTLSSDDLAELGTLERLRSLVLFGTNVTDEDLSHLKRCPSLEHLNLVRTEITDAAIDTLLEMKELRSLCLGDVNVTPAAIERLRERNRRSDRDHQLRWGYSQRKP